SPAFEEVFRDSRSRQGAIVVFRPATGSQPRARGRLRALDRRLRQIRENARAQETLQRNVLERYLRDFGHSAEHGGSLAADQVGSSVLNVAEVEVTPESLSGLAESPEVLAVMPNQALHMIRPRLVDYRDLSIREGSSGLTWGLERMEIPRVWARTRGA